MVKSYVKRIAAAAVMTAVCLGATTQIGLPQIAYAFNDNDKEVMMTINGSDVLKDEYADYYSYCKAVMESSYGMGEYIWSAYPEAVQQLVAATDNNCIYARVIVDKFKELGLDVDKDRDRAWRGSAWDLKQTKNDTIKKLEAQGMTFDEWLSTMGMNEEMYDNIFAQGYYLEALNNYYFGVNGKNAPSEDEIKKEFDKYYKAKHILITNTDEQGNKLTGEALQKKKDLVDKIQKELADGADFDELMNKYSEDPGLANYPDGYVFQDDGSFVEEFVNATASLEVGAITTEPVESDYGWHIIKREALTDEDYETYRPQIVYNMTGMTIDSMVQQWMQEADVKYPDGHEDMTISDVLGEEAGKTPSLQDALGGANSSSSSSSSSSSGSSSSDNASSSTKTTSSETSANSSATPKS